MADIKVIYVNSNGFYQEHSESGDSIKVLSLKTANKELTDAKLSDLIDGADANDQHIHDARYYRENEFISSSAGVADANKPAKTNAGGYVNDLINVSSLNSALDHGALTGLGDDDHTQYILASGTRAFTGAQSMGGFKLTNVANPTVGTDAVNLQTLQANQEGLKPKQAVRVATTANINLASAPAAIDGITLSSGNRVLVKDQSLPEANGIYIFNGAGSAMTRATDFDSLSPLDEINGAYTFAQEGTANAGKGYVQTGTVATLGTDPITFVFFNAAASITASTGLVKVGNDIQIDPSAAGAGLGFSAGVLSVNVDAATIEINSDTLRVKADGINDTIPEALKKIGLKETMIKTEREDLQDCLTHLAFSVENNELKTTNKLATAISIINSGKNWVAGKLIEQENLVLEEQQRKINELKKIKEQQLKNSYEIYKLENPNFIEEIKAQNPFIKNNDIADSVGFSKFQEMNLEG